MMQQSVVWIPTWDKEEIQTALCLFSPDPGTNSRLAALRNVDGRWDAILVLCAWLPRRVNFNAVVAHPLPLCIGSLDIIHRPDFGRLFFLPFSCCSCCRRLGLGCLKRHDPMMEADAPTIQRSVRFLMINPFGSLSCDLLP